MYDKIHYKLKKEKRKKKKSKRTQTDGEIYKKKKKKESELCDVELEAKDIKSMVAKRTNW